MAEAREFQHMAQHQGTSDTSGSNGTSGTSIGDQEGTIVTGWDGVTKHIAASLN